MVNLDNFNQTQVPFLGTTDSVSWEIMDLAISKKYNNENYTGLNPVSANYISLRTLFSLCLCFLTYQMGAMIFTSWDEHDHTFEELRIVPGTQQAFNYSELLL